MDRTKLRNYAPQARRDFIQAVTDRATFYGLAPEKIEPIIEKGDVVIIAGRAFPASVAPKRKALQDRIERNGFSLTMEALAYTWFNRFVAIRFMELHGYLDHAYRVLSNPDSTKTIPEIVDRAEHVDLKGLNKKKVIDLKLDASKEAELYQTLLVAQCNALHSAMPFLFERIADETELVLPDNLLHSDSVIRKLVTEIDEEDWKEVEIIGWLYQFYISEKKAEVIGKVVASEDIPAATQLFTPKWIVKYLVQNTLGRQWLATYPHSTLRQQMQYYIEPTEQTPEVQEQLKAITPTSLNLEELTLLDPACGSGHILVEAYDLFKAIYQERGYRAKDIPALILEKNLFGLEIDERAAQLAAFALMMKARADDRRIFDSEAKPNILAFQDSQEMDAAAITRAINSPINKEDVANEYLFEEIEEEKAGLFSKKALGEKGHIALADIASLRELFENAKTFGSLIQVPSKLATKLPEMECRLNDVLKHGDLTHTPADILKPLLQQARLLASRYDAVVANPPYMGGKYYSPTLKAFVNEHYKDAKADLYTCFIQRNIDFAKQGGMAALITIPTWMFLSSSEQLRKSVLAHHLIESLIHNGRGVFGSDFGTCAFVIRNSYHAEYRGTFRRLFDKPGSVASNEELMSRFFSVISYTPTASGFRNIPGSPIAYSATKAVHRAYSKGRPLAEIASPKQGLATTDNARFIRFWSEVSIASIGFGCADCEAARATKKMWFPIDKGGPFRKWYGNNEHVVNWKNDGKEIKDNIIRKYPYLNGDPDYVAKNPTAYFKPGVTWGKVTIAAFSARIDEPGFVFSDAGMKLFHEDADHLLHLLGFFNSVVSARLLSCLAETLNFEQGNIARLPVIDMPLVTSLQQSLVSVARCDWNSLETSWNFQMLPTIEHKAATVQLSQSAADAECLARFGRMKELEAENNRLFIDAYGLQDELSPKVPDDQITLCRPDRSEDIKRLLSYTIGCTMGRYSLDKPGLIYAHSGNQGFDPNQYKVFGADDDGIISVLEMDWGIRGDAASRIVEFIGVSWPKEHLEENLKFIADSLGTSNNEQPRVTIRRYLATGFYKHHLSMYKKRPIYWLFSSGKHRAFQSLMYLHRYNEGTLSRMRTECVIPLQGKIASRIDQLASDIQKTAATSHRRRLEKERDSLLKQQSELKVFEEKLRHYADLRIKLDLDEGVKVNYGKFGDLLAEVNSVTGGSDD